MARCKLSKLPYQICTNNNPPCHRVAVPDATRVAAFFVYDCFSSLKVSPPLPYPTSCVWFCPSKPSTHWPLWSLFKTSGMERQVQKMYHLLTLLSQALLFTLYLLICQFRIIVSLALMCSFYFKITTSFGNTQ